VNPRVFVVVGLSVLSASVAKSAELSLSDYLNQVRGGNGSYQAASKLSGAAQKISLEAGLLTVPSFFTNVQSQDDRRPPQLLFQATRTANFTVQSGVEAQTKYGLSGKLYYQVSDVQLEGLNPAFLTRGPHFVLASPVLELNQSFWRNGFGSELTAQQSALESLQLATYFRESFSKTMKIAEAESTYWRLATAREVIRIQKSLVERAQKMVDWSSRRERLNLGDRADRLQVDALLLSRKVDLDIAEDELRDAGYAFNVGRGKEGSEVAESLELPKSNQLLDWKVPERTESREDLKALQKQSEALVASSLVNAEKNRPQLDVFGNFSLNALEATTADAISKSISTDRPVVTVGLRFKTPLALGTTAKIAEGRTEERVAAEVSYRQKQFEQDQEWRNMAKKLDEAKARLKMTDQLVSLQESKLSYEKDRLMRGRTTTFQVLQFEADFGAAELARVRSASAVLNLQTQLKTFGGVQ
jgi:outer membrane protein TolC